MPKGIFIRTEEHKKNIGKAHKGLKRSEEARQHMRKPHRKFKLSQEVIEKFRKGKNNPFYGKHHTEKTKQENRETHKGSRNSRWKGGKIKTGEGYFQIWKPNHPHCNHMGYVLEHRLVMEKHLGRYLKPEEIVHHRNENHSDNRIKNLRLFANHSKHRKFHWSQRVPIISNAYTTPKNS